MVSLKNKSQYESIHVNKNIHMYTKLSTQHFTPVYTVNFDIRRTNCLKARPVTIIK